ncbi:hypothetical protein D039_0309B, partial [Vibrio parahaemolyticus EKP-028]
LRPKRRVIENSNFR